jgi:branched-chain amino acid transport system permease protein
MATVGVQVADLRNRYERWVRWWWPVLITLFFFARAHDLRVFFGLVVGGLGLLIERSLPEDRRARLDAALPAIAALSLALAYSFLQASDAGDFFNFTVIGIAEGCVFAIAASGLVLTYATTGVFNFAHGAVGMISAYVFYTFSQQLSWPVPIAIFITLFVFAPLVGLLIERVMRSFRDAPVQTAVVVTIALTVLLIGVAQKLYPASDAATLPKLLGENHNLKIGPANPTYDNVLALVLAVAVAVLLRFLLFGSRTGTAMRAVVDNPTLAALNGAQPVAIARYSWMLGSVLAALAGILLASGTNLDPIVLTFFVAGAYGAAVVGKLKSLPLTFAGAIALGIAKNFALFALPPDQVWQSVRNAIPGIFLFGALLLVPAAKLSVGRVVGRQTPRVPGLTSSLARAAVFVGLVVLVSRVAPADRMTDLTRGMIYALLLLSLVLLTGFSGQISLCQYVFMAIGAWAMGSTFGGNSLLGMLVAGLAAVPLGVLVALPALRLQGLYLALVTFGFATVARDLVLENPRVFGEGSVDVGRLHLFGINAQSNEAFFVLCGVTFALVAVVVLVLKRGPFGRRLAALRDSQAACATLGLNVNNTKLVVFALSAFIAGVAGALFGGLNSLANTIQFEPIFNIILLLFAVVGGVTTVSGAFIGGALFAMLPFVQSEYPDQAGLVFAIVAVAAVALGKQPNGIAGVLYSRLDGLRRASRPAAPAPAPAARPAAPAAPVKEVSSAPA